MALSELKHGNAYNNVTHKELLLDVDSDYANLPGLDECAPGSEAASIESGKHWILKHTGVWDLKQGGGGGGNITVEELTVTENGIVTAPTGKAYSPVNVTVPQITVEPLSVSENGVYTAPSGKAYSPVTVAVPVPLGFVKEKTLIDTTLTIDEDIATSSVTDIVTYTVDPVLKQDYLDTENFFIFGTVMWKGSIAPEDLSANQFVFAVTTIPLDRESPAYYVIPQNSGILMVRYSGTYSFSSLGNQKPGLRFMAGSVSATGMSMKIRAENTNGTPVKAGDYAVKADMYRFDFTKI